MNKVLKILIISLVTSINSFSQTNPVWDDTSKKGWNSSFAKVEIPSSNDDKIQLAYIYSSSSKTPKPLIVSLHTWSGNYEQEDPLASEILARDWNYIHPDFRGPNNHPSAGGSHLVISDIEDAIRYALEFTNSDPKEVHIIGVSGGGYATLIAFMNVRYPVKSFSAWAPISDLESWYYESVGRNNKYAADIINIVSEDKIFNREEAFRRSPIAHNFPKDIREDGELFIYTGIHDGYKGSVPITHSINFYNRLVGDLKYDLKNLDEIIDRGRKDPDIVSEKKIIELLTKRHEPTYLDNKMIFDRSVHLYKSYRNITLQIFEGGHEQIPQALSLIPFNYKTDIDLNILIIGDSNAKNIGGWVDMLRKKMPNSTFINKSESGRTIGFDNLGIEDLNALTKIEVLLDEAKLELGDKSFDYIFLCLGTNDAKNEFSHRQDEVISNFEALLEKIKVHPFNKTSLAEFVYITPPPFGSLIKGEKYIGSNERLLRLLPHFSKIASMKGFKEVDINLPLREIYDNYAPDGVHMSAKGQEIIAQKIIDVVFYPD